MLPYTYSTIQCEEVHTPYTRSPYGDDPTHVIIEGKRYEITAIVKDRLVYNLKRCSPQYRKRRVAQWKEEVNRCGRK